MVLKDERGFLAVPVLMFFFLVLFITLAVTASAAFGARKNAQMVYHWFGESVEFAKDAVVRNYSAAGLSSREGEARQWFIYAFSKATESSYSGGYFNSSLRNVIPGPIKLAGFRYVPPNTPAPYGGRTAGPGFEATVEVPVFKASLPFIGEQTLVVPMRYVASVAPTAEVK